MLAFIVAVIVAALGAEIPFGLRVRTTLLDLLGFGPLYAAVVAATFLVAFPIASRLPGPRGAWFALAGFVGLIAAIRLIDSLVPPPVLIAATRGTLGLLAMTAGGALGGLAYARLRRKPE